jgi:hypothetical protein
VSYSQEISRECKGVFLFMVDQSRSMNKEFGPDQSGKMVSRAVVVANALNGTLEELVNRCMRDEGVRDYFDIGIIGYGRTNRPEFCWRGALAGRRLVPIPEVASKAEIEEVDIETEVRGQVLIERITLSRWIDPVGVDSTPMNAALRLAHSTLEDWVRDNPHSFPPVVINITDGMANDVNTDADLLDTARQLTNVRTSDGNVLLINCHIAGGADAPVVFPSSQAELPSDPYARLLFEMSSELSNRHRSIICEVFDRDLERTPTIKGMAFNADATALLKLLDIGTRQAIGISAPIESYAALELGPQSVSIDSFVMEAPAVRIRPSEQD